MNRRRTRRNFLAAVGSTAAATLAGCNTGDQGSESSPETSASATKTRTQTDVSTQHTETDTGAVDVVEHDRRVGAYYYSWYNSNYPFREDTPAEPVLGYYNSADTEVVNQHITWAVEHGINWLNMSWDGRNTPDNHSPEDEAIRTGFLEADLNDLIDFSIFYESNTILELADDDTLNFGLETNRQTLRRDLQYLEDTFFDRSNYLTVNDRPVVTFYAAHSFGGPVRDAFEAALDGIDHDPYLVATVLDNTQNRTNDWIDVFDAVTGYNIYNERVAANGDFADFVDYSEEEMREWMLVADHVDLDMIPVVTPGYNDTEIEERSGSRPVLERDPDGFRSLSRTVHDWMEPELQAIMVTSFNEWPEYTAVEPAESYGTTYLEVIEEELARSDEPTRPDVSEYPVIGLDFDRAVPAPEEPVSFTMMFDALTLEDSSGRELVRYDIGVPEEEPYILDGAFRPKSGDDGMFDTWRWLGGPTGSTLLAVDPEYRDATTAGIRGAAPPFAEEPVGADVYVNGERTDHITIDTAADTYQAALQPE